MGFECFRKLMDKYKPLYLVHGHTHITYGHNVPRVIDYNGTRVINAYERYTIEVPDRPFPARKFGQVLYKTRYRQSYLDNDI